MNIKSTCLGLSLLAVLTACSSLPYPTPLNEANASKQPAATTTLTHWTINGAIAAKNKHKHLSAMFLWQQQGPQHFKMQLFGPLHGSTVFLEQNGTHFTYQDGQKSIQSTHAEALILRETGIKMPMKQLYYWLRGIKAPGPAQHQQRNEQGQLQALQQDGFTLKFSTYTAVNKRMLPSKIEISHAEGSLRIVIKQWIIN